MSGCLRNLKIRKIFSRHLLAWNRKHKWTYHEVGRAAKDRNANLCDCPNCVLFEDVWVGEVPKEGVEKTDSISFASN